MFPYRWLLEMSPKLTPISWKKLVKVFEKDGFSVDRVEGSHVILTKPGVVRPIVVPKYAEVGLDIIQSNMRTAGMNRNRFFTLVSEI
uniref:Predicted RNA binding protein YcfA, dsRBD-like fold, HicA-like mRNA interferase family n=1 Tax=Candidatus Kentrum sp. LPFa TaxID=2126335 RepID=A0A450W165_9GAMM|nr:MAG: Predicted RNA binding protein YcfA, dsRBD-like fold, HicA-like mRNA interferase family [Candidatus Kentron sp. LPFa]